MSLADLSIRRPIFVTCLVLVMLVVGTAAMKNLGVDLFPDVNFPIVTVTIPYPGAGPSEIETLVSKPVEDEISTIAGLRRLTSKNLEGASIVVAEFRLEVDVRHAEQQIRDRISSVKVKLPTDIKEPVIRRLDPADQPVLTLSLTADLGEGELFDVADEYVRTRLEQVPDVGLVDIKGGRKREIHVALDRKKLRAREISASQIVGQLSASGENVPSGKVNEGSSETIFRALGEFRSLNDIKGTLVSLYGNEVATTVGEVGEVRDTLQDEKTRVFYNGKRSLFIDVYRQSGTNTIAVVDAAKLAVEKISPEIGRMKGSPKLGIVRDGSKWIRVNVEDVRHTIFMGVILTILVVFVFLANFRSTLITGLALPNSLIGAFILMAMAGFTINIITLLAISLAVGLLIDDAIVVRENIFRKLEQGMDPIEAAKKGTAEVRLAVIATTLVVIAVFGPVAYLKGFTGQFFRQFGLTICFAMAISLFDALTIAPMLSAYFAGDPHKKRRRSIWSVTLGWPLRVFEGFQIWLENRYERILHFSLRHPVLILFGSLVIFVASFMSLSKVPKTFIPPQDAGEFVVIMDMPPGTNLERMNEVGKKADEIVRKNPEIAVSSLTIGGRNGEPNLAELYVQLVPSDQRKVNTTAMKERLREQMKAMAEANPKVQDFNPVAGGGDFRPFMMRLIGSDQAELEKYGAMAFEKLRKHPGLKDVDTSYRPGKPEFQVALNPRASTVYGINTKTFGGELRVQVEGLVAAKYREKGREYDVRVRMLPDQRNLRDNFKDLFVPNVNGKLVKLSDIATGKEARGPANIDRQDRGRFVQIAGDIAPGAGLGDIMADVTKMFETDIMLPPGVRFAYVGDSENFAEFAVAMGYAIGFSVLFIFLVLASLYESFVTPFTIMLALPLAMCGAFLGLFVTGQSVNLFSMIGVIMLLGVASKNSILLVDYTNQLIEGGMDRSGALIKAGRTRLRPILMTTMALIAGTLPVAMGLTEASKQRTSMGVAIIGGLISSTILTLVVVPAAFSYVDRFRLWSKGILMRWTQPAPKAKKGSLASDNLPELSAPEDQTEAYRL